MIEHDRFDEAIMVLARAPSGIIWRQATRALALCIIHGPDPVAFVDAGAVPLLHKLSKADHLEFQTDALRALSRLADASEELRAVALAGDYWRTLLDVGDDTNVPLICQIVAELLLHAANVGGGKDMAPTALPRVAKWRENAAPLAEESLDLLLANLKLVEGSDGAAP